MSLRAVVASHPLKPAIQQRTGSDERWARAEDGDCLAKTVVDRAVPIAFAAQSDVVWPVQSTLRALNAADVNGGSRLPTAPLRRAVGRRAGPATSYRRSVPGLTTAYA